MSKWIKRDDQVVVVSGNDKGVAGSVLARKKEKVLIKGVNVRKKHMRRRDENSQSQILDLERPIHISNVALADQDGQPVKPKVVISDSGDKELHTVTKDGQSKYLRTIKKAKK